MESLLSVIKRNDKLLPGRDFDVVTLGLNPKETPDLAAAKTVPGFAWGQVWEWTGSPFAPYPGFVAHPYRDYSAPWFDGRPVLKGFCAATAQFMAHVCYRNYFTPERRDIFAGFRSAASLN